VSIAPDFGDGPAVSCAGLSVFGQATAIVAACHGFEQRFQEGVVIDVTFLAGVVHGGETGDRTADTSHPEVEKDTDGRRPATAPSAPLPPLVNQGLRGTPWENAENLDFPDRIRMRARRGGPAKRIPDQDAADLTDLELSAFNRFSSPPPA